MKSGSTPLPVCRNSVLFDNSLNDKRFRIDIRMENGYEEGCTRGAKRIRGPPPGGPLVRLHLLRDSTTLISRTRRRDWLRAIGAYALLLGAMMVVLAFRLRSMRP